MKRRLGATLLVLAALVFALPALPALADSQARIVRLSDVEGNVKIDRNTGQGYENAFLNMPIIEGTKLWAKEDTRAEVEFEDGSTLGITSNTIVEFTQLSLRDSGARVSVVKVQEGLAYVNFAGKKNDEFTVNFAREKVALTQAAHFRVEVDDTEATLAVFKGDVSVAGPSGTVEVSRKHSASFDLAKGDQSTLAKDYEQVPEDAWDQQQSEYQQRYSSTSSYGSMPYSYGYSDLNYYGTFMNVPGYGSMWQPYLTSANWDPFMDGAWMWYPGYGYTWVSAYPWGWMPYRYGNWVFVPGYGWLWQPGYWTTWRPVPTVLNPPNRYHPPQPPTRGGPGVVVVGRGTVTPAPGGSRRITLREDSAGLDVPRGYISHLGKVSQRVSTVGSVTVPMTPTVRIAPVAPSGMSSGSRSSTPSVGPRMSAPAPPARSAPPARGSSPHG